MDKLKPIITHRFWILAGLALLLPLIGWWSSTSAMVSEFKQRTGELDSSFSSAKLQPGPNQKWIEPIKALNGEETRKVEETRTLLWDHQLPLMTDWPESIAKDMKDLDPKAEIDATVRNKYRTLYGMEIKRLWRIPKPYDEEERTGRVIFPEEVLPAETWPENPFPPSTKVMRDSQEDIWLLKSLLEAIDAVNEDNGAPNLMDAAIRQIKVIELRGGSKDKPKTATAPAGPAGPAGTAAKPASNMPIPRGNGPSTLGGGPGARGPGGPGAGGQGADGASIDLTEVFGSDAETTTSGPASGGTNAPRAPGPATGPGTGGAPGGGHGGPPSAPAGLSVAGRGADAPKKRYIEENDQYRTRAFYLVVTMDQMQVPNLITKLSNMPWSAKIVRVHQVDHDRSDVPSGGGVTSRGPGQTMGGMGTMGQRPAGGHSGGAAPRPMQTQRPMPTGGGESGMGGAAGTGGNELTAAMSDPALVDVAIAGIFTLYLPPPPPPPAAPGAPTPAGPTAPATAAPAAATEETPTEEMTEGEGEGEPAAAEEMPAETDAVEEEMEKPDADSEPAAESEKGAEKPAGKPKPGVKPEDDQ